MKRWGSLLLLVVALGAAAYFVGPTLFPAATPPQKPEPKVEPKSFGPRAAQASRIGVTNPQAASSSSARMNSVGSPLRASKISRS